MPVVGSGSCCPASVLGRSPGSAAEGRPGPSECSPEHWPSARPGSDAGPSDTPLQPWTYGVFALALWLPERPVLAPCRHKDGPATSFFRLCFRQPWAHGRGLVRSPNCTLWRNDTGLCFHFSSLPFLSLSPWQALASGGGRGGRTHLTVCRPSGWATARRPSLRPHHGSSSHVERESFLKNSII